jgi:alkyl hydroperoxide reductase subunit AhpC
LHKNIDDLNGMDMNVYIVSKDTPEQQVKLYDKLKEYFGYSLPFVSDPKLKLIDYMGMKNGDAAFRGYGILDQEGKVVFKTANDLWGDEFDKTIKQIKEEYKKINNK